MRVLICCMMAFILSACGARWSLIEIDLENPQNRPTIHKPELRLIDDWDLLGYFNNGPPIIIVEAIISENAKNIDDILYAIPLPTPFIMIRTTEPIPEVDRIIASVDSSEKPPLDEAWRIITDDGVTFLSSPASAGNGSGMNISCGPDVILFLFTDIITTNGLVNTYFFVDSKQAVRSLKATHADNSLYFEVNLLDFKKLISAMRNGDNMVIAGAGKDLVSINLQWFSQISTSYERRCEAIYQ